MILESVLEEAKVEYKQLYWKWEDENYVLETAEFTEDGSLVPMKFGLYLMMMAYKMNKRKHNQRYTAIKRKIDERWECTIVEIIKYKEEVNDGPI